MRQQHSSARSATPASGEYVTNWKAVYGAAVVAGMLVSCIAASCWFAGEPKPHTANVNLSSTNESMAPSAMRDLPARQLVFRRARWESEAPPPPDLTKYQLWYGAASATFRSAAHGSETAGACWAVTRLRPLVNSLAREPAPAAPQYQEPQFAKADTGKEQENEKGSPGYDKALQEYLASEIPTLDLNTVSGTSQWILTFAKANHHNASDPHVQVFERLTTDRADLQGLPLLLGNACASERQTAISRQETATKLRDALHKASHSAALARLPESRRNPEHDEVIKSNASVSGNMRDARWQTAEQVPILEQLCQAEAVALRLEVVDMVAQIKEPQASQALARRALFDTSEEVRQAARKHLQCRDRQEFAKVIERGLNYPWPTVVERTKLLVAQIGQAGTPARQPPQSEWTELASLASQRGGISAPYRSCDDRWVVNELVKVNHLRNCVMCHAVSHNEQDPLRGQIPTPGQRLPRIYYNSNKGNFIRADIVYIRQDFSVMLPVENAEPWPQMQRFDFFVRTRAATEAELAANGAREPRQSKLLRTQAHAELQQVLQEGADAWRRAVGDWDRALANSPDKDLTVAN